MKKKILLSTLFAIIAFFAVTACTSKVEAAVTWANNTNEMTITRDVNNVTNPVTNQFGYQIVAKNDNPTGASGNPETQGVIMNNVSPVNGTATGNGTLSFANVTFTQVGDYHFTVTESSSSNSTSYPVDGTNTYDVVVRVTNDTNQGDFIATLIGQVTNSNNDPSKKSNMEFENNANMESLQITKNVTGDMGNKDEYFKVQVTVQGNNGDTFDVTGADSGNLTYKETTVTNPNTITANTATVMYLKHGQTITIGKTAANIEQIPINTYCQIEEQDMSNTGYTVSYNGNSQASLTYQIVSGDNLVTITNNKQSETLTGLFMDYGPYVLLVALAIVGLVIIKKNSVK